jgi:hypothetical protein
MEARANRARDIGARLLTAAFFLNPEHTSDPTTGCVGGARCPFCTSIVRSNIHPRRLRATAAIQAQQSTARPVRAALWVPAHPSDIVARVRDSMFGTWIVRCPMCRRCGRIGRMASLVQTRSLRKQHRQQQARPPPAKRARGGSALPIVVASAPECVGALDPPAPLSPLVVQPVPPPLVVHPVQWGHHHWEPPTAADWIRALGADPSFAPVVTGTMWS